MVSGTALRRLCALLLAAACVLATGLVPTASAAEPLQWRDRSPRSDARLRGLAPVSQQVAWVSGSEGAVLRTTDGGKTWRDVSPGGDTAELEFRDIEAWDAKTAVVMSIGEAGDSRIYRTTDGGRTWRLGFQNREADAFYDCFGFWDRQHGLAMSDPVDGRFRVIATDDGGRTWQRRSPKGMPRALKGEFAFAASGTCLVTAGTDDAWIASGGAAARVFHSTDRGRTWSVTDTPVVRSDAGGVFSLAVRDPQTLVAVGGDFERPQRARRTAARSVDGGATWTRGEDLHGYRSGSAFLPAVDASAPSRGVVAVGPTGTDVSYDAGATWERVRGAGSLDSVECTADGACWGSGEDGRVAVLRGAGGVG